MTDNKSKNYPAATPEVALMLGLNQNPENHSQTAEQTPDLSVGKSIGVLDEEVGHSPSNFESKITADVAAAKKHRLAPIVKLVLPYLVLFVLGVFAYYFFFSKFNFSAIFNRTSKTVQKTVKETAVSQLEKQNLTAYNAWIKSYYFDVSDPAVLDPEGDNSGNGLSNFQKFLFKLNPKAYDTLGLGMSDTEALAQGINPLTGGKLTDEQKTILDNYVDLEVAMNRLALANAQGRSHVAGATVWSGLRGGTQNSYFLGNGGSVAGNNSTFGLPAQANQSLMRQTGSLSALVTGAALGGASQDTLGVNGLDVDTNIPGRLQIPDLNINVPIIWTTDTKNFSRDLQNGVVHYPGTALPGQIGTSYISGHSSNYVWAKGSYNQIFATLGNLPVNTSFKITVVQKNGKDARLHYVVTGSKEYKPTDQAQFASAGKSVVALSTCWPVGSTAKRLVVFGEMTQMEKD